MERMQTYAKFGQKKSPRNAWVTFASVLDGRGKRKTDGSVDIA